MNKAAWGAAALGALALGCGPSAPKTSTPPPFQSTDSAGIGGLKILVFGDSLTAGKDLPDPSVQSYPAVLERLLRAEGRRVTVINAGHSGDTTADALARVDFSLAEKPDLAIVALGANDTFQGKPLADIEKNLDLLLDRFDRARVPVILAGLKTFPNLGPFYVRGFSAIFPRLARRHRVPLIPFLLEGVAAVPELNLEDGIHPNAAGCEIVARHVRPYVEKFLKEGK